MPVDHKEEGGRRWCWKWLRLLLGETSRLHLAALLVLLPPLAAGSGRVLGTPPASHCQCLSVRPDPRVARPKCAHP